ncbi:hypothetical protein E2C01_074843 [Portunus trituberculatus]|uniref:Uncharacterized protein n=1 Tax=Portunus trituberculatus TaxID=210409 RepID=A0A5B7IEJ8_PORTR|nr:hypothetical protein [Portunus trituberculatus]
MRKESVKPKWFEGGKVVFLEQWRTTVGYEMEREGGVVRKGVWREGVAVIDRGRPDAIAS